MRAHAVLAGALAAAVLLRLVAVLGYPSALWFGDSVGYLRSAINLEPSRTRPSGYSLLLWLLRPLHGLVAVVTVQHLLGLATGVVLYALARRHVRAAWPRPEWLPGVLGTAVAVPVLFDAYQIELEHLLLSDTLFTFLVVSLVAVLLWRPDVTGWTAVCAGLLLGMAAVTRTVGLPLLALVLGWLVLRGRRAALVPAVALTAACLLPVGLYMSWFHAAHRQYAMTTAGNVFLYGRAVGFADCRIIKPRPALVRMCPHTPPVGISPAYASLWTDRSPFASMPGGKSGGNELAGEFAYAAIRAQPADYAWIVLRDTARAFTWERTVYPSPWTFRKYEFPSRAKPLADRQKKVARAYSGFTGPQPVVEPMAGWMRGYQHRMRLPGSILGLLLLAGASGMLFVRGTWRQALLPWLTSLALLVVPAATADFDYRYVVPAFPLGALAALLAFVRGRRPAGRAGKRTRRTAPRTSARTG
ncbi:hypothetical protein [Actinomadura xylanilytica]|uniref:hypothetical protein n=1 Tax=Actinomadura xylanilytica TaxID=887459 RepID=UPI00255AFDB9|nr:hypothetical protein [Actinomadura xylanilytica]MDL4776202.1 hypothetical protein [Actinomadura xylanilytica]